MDYDVIYNGKVIANITAMSDAEARRTAKAIYGKDVTAERV